MRFPPPDRDNPTSMLPCASDEACADTRHPGNCLAQDLTQLVEWLAVVLLWCPEITLNDFRVFLPE